MLFCVQTLAESVLSDFQDLFGVVINSSKLLALNTKIPYIMNVSSILKDGTGLGLKNFLSLVGVVILYTLTCWIPYLNVGTTIALICLPAAMSRGEAISPTEIFAAKYRENMGNFFLLCVFYTMAIVIGLLFGVIPGIVLGYAWFIAFLLLVDKGMEPLQALAESNKRTNGKKATIFWAFLALGVLYSLAYLLVGYVCADKLQVLGAVITLILSLLYFPIQMGCQAVVYRELTSDLNS